MPATIREQILTNLLAALQTLAPGVTVWDHETRQPTPEDMPVVNLLGGDHRPGDRATGLTLYQLDVDLDCWVTAADGAALKTAIAAIYGAALAAASADVTLGGVATDLREQECIVSYDTQEGHQPLANVTLSLVVDYGQREGDPYTPAP